MSRAEEALLLIEQGYTPEQATAILTQPDAPTEYHTIEVLDAIVAWSHFLYFARVLMPASGIKDVQMRKARDALEVLKKLLFEGKL